MAASDLIGSGTADGLIAFCDYLMDRGIAPASSVNPWKSAAKSVFTRVEGTENYGGVDVRSLDVDEYMTRFIHKSRGEYKPESLSAYASRFHRAVDAYRGYLEDPAGWRPRLRASSRRASDGGADGRTDGRTGMTDGGGTPTPVAGPTSAPLAASPSAPLPGLIDYPFPMRSGQIAHLHLPSQLDSEDADRLTQFVRALVFERQPQLPSGEPGGE